MAQPKKKLPSDIDRGWYVDLTNGQRYTFGFICRMLGESVTLSDIAESSAMKQGQISEAEFERVKKLFDENGELIVD